ncbi:MAG: 5-carboxymethyl-2-hydroxymuconate Delta-isomerase [Neisseriaceae bacterium]|nr:5-carboxymethyl-2-hydroxymuconate Delta-isomerase [Neisseriaceae bacterium]
MPHLYLEYTTPQLDGLDSVIPSFLQHLNEVVFASGEFPVESAIKTRVIQVVQHRIGTVDLARGFVHLRLHLLSGRSPEFKKQLSENLLGVLKVFVPQDLSCDLSVEMVDIDRPSYSQVTIGV